MTTQIERYVAFSSDPSGGNPAGVVLDASGLDDGDMLAIAAEVGYSETAFLFPTNQERHHDVRYFSPKAEVAFCGHATVASGVALAERDGTGLFTLHTRTDEVPVETSVDGQGNLTAQLTSPSAAVDDVDPGIAAEALAALGWDSADLDPALPMRVASAGNQHLVVAARDRARLAELDYDFDRLGTLMAKQEWTTVHLVWRAGPLEFHARDPFPPGGVVEDAATGAAAAAFGGYLKELGLVRAPATVRIVQGEDMGRPSLLTLDIAAEHNRMRVAGTATRL